MTTHTDRDHARLAPSSAHRWLKCPGSVALSEGLEEAPSSFANEGTAAHMLAQRCMEGGNDAYQWRGWVIDTSVKGGLDPWFRPGYPGVKADGINRFAVDHEMVDGVQLFLDVCREISDSSEEFEVEQRLDVSAIVAGVYGTGDCIAYRSQPTRRVTIVDLKYGRGVAVDVDGNEQELSYALGVAARYHNRGVDEVELVIVQPRAPHRDGPVRRWVTDLVGLYEFAMEAQDGAERVNDPNAPRIPGSWCKFCRGAAICGELRDKVFEIIGAKRNALGFLDMADPAKYSPEELAQKLADLPLVNTWYKGVEQFGHSEAVAGRVAPGWKLVAKRATRKWKNEDEAELALLIAGVDKEDIFETSMRSPAQIETCISKSERKAVIGELAEAQSSGTSLAPIADPRPAVDPGSARGFEPVDVAERH